MIFAPPRGTCSRSPSSVKTLAEVAREFDHYSATATANHNARHTELQNISRRLERLEMK